MDKEKLIADLQEAMRSGNREELERLAKEAVVNFPNEAFGYYFLAEANVLKPNYPNAEVCLVKAIELNNDPTYKIRLARVKEEQGLFDDARLIFARALSQDSKNIHALYGLGMYYMEQAHDYPEAISYLDQAIAIEPGHFDARLARANCLIKMEDFNTSLDDLNFILEDGYLEAALLLKISALSELDDRVELNAAYALLLENDPENVPQRFNYAHTLFYDQQVEEAATQLNLILKSGTDNQVMLEASHKLLSSIQLDLNNFEAAIESFDQLIAWDAEKFEANLGKAKALAGLERYDEALAILQQARKEGDEGALIYILELEAQIHSAQSNFEQALKAYEQMADDDLYAADAYFGMGQIYHQQGNTTKAFDTLLKAADLKNKSAKEFLQDNYKEQLDEKTKTLEREFEADFARNQSTKALQSHFGKLYRFSFKDTKFPASIPLTILKSMKDNFDEQTIFFTEKAFLLINVMDKQPLMGFYKVLNARDTAANIEVTSFDGTSTKKIQLANKNGLLAFNPLTKSKQNFLFKTTKVDQLPASLVKTIKKFVTADDIEHFGDSATEFKAILE